MIKLESVHIEEVRGIRKLDIDFKKSTFAISGPNGSGKSGVIDAIEFGLTGQIGRLTGHGTKGLTVTEHGPHVDKIRFPDIPFVELRLFFQKLGKSAVIVRKVSAPKKPIITPADDDIKAAIAEIAEHPEITLTRRDILRFILVEPTKRSEEIQAILKLDALGQTRAALYAAMNKLKVRQQTTTAQVEASGKTLRLHLQTTALHPEDLMLIVNQRRKLLGLSDITELTVDTDLDEGLSAIMVRADFNKQSALRDLNALVEATKGFQDLAKTEVKEILDNLERLENDPALLAALRHRKFIENGLELVKGPMCPLCDMPWDNEQHLKDHLKEKLAKSAEAQNIQNGLLQNGTAIAKKVITVSSMLGPIQKLAETQGENAFAQMLMAWKTDLEKLKSTLTTVDGLLGLKVRFKSGWLAIPGTFLMCLSTFIEKMKAKPDQTTTHDAQTFLTTAKLRFGDYREACRKNEAAEIAYNAAKEAYETYCVVLDEELNTLYSEVEKDFSEFYRVINEDDEPTFKARLTPTEGKLELEVNFYERGLFPPAAYHSEGHQDGMGVCLYLALMKRLFGGQFTFALFDDVVMSVDAGHRYNFCKLLKKYFNDTQFIITTHDRVWAEQMKAVSLVTGKSSLTFHRWSIDSGPLVETSEEIWADIAASLTIGKVGTAAATLRHHLEYVSQLLANQIGASIQYRADGNYELGELLPNVLNRMKELYGKAAEVSQSWGDLAMRDIIVKRKDTLSKSNGAVNVEQWAVNKAVHYNEWANFEKKDFEPVVAAYKELLACFRCETCGAWLYVTPRMKPESLRCFCNKVTLNLKLKPKKL